MSKVDRRKKSRTNPSADFIALICSLYNDTYDDREEGSSLGGEDWVPGVKANHQSLESFRKELKNDHGIELSTAKIRKILITGGLWTTELSRMVAELYEEEYHAIPHGAKVLGVTPSLVTMYLPYEKPYMTWSKCPAMQSGSSGGGKSDTLFHKSDPIKIPVSIDRIDHVFRRLSIRQAVRPVYCSRP